MSKSVLIVENSNSSLKLNESAVTKAGERRYLLGGEFTRFGVKNRNDRVYTAEKFLPSLQELNERMNTLGAVYGEFDHPDIFDLSLSKASHVLREVKYLKEENIVTGSIELLNTMWGKEARSIVDMGLPLFVSSRAAGVTEANGEVALKKLFTYDAVADPGFATAKMSSINESLGFKNTSQTNFRIYEMADDSKINDLFNMNKNDLVTKKMISDYSDYLVTEIASIKTEVNSALKTGKLESNEMTKLLEYYENLNKTQGKISEYLDYLANTVQIVVNENKELKATQTQLISHNDYLAEQLEKSIGYSEYLGEELDKGIEFSENVNEKLEKTIAYNEYLAEELDKSIVYSEYLAENVDKTIEYGEYLAENLDKSLEYSEYLAENLDKSIEYGEYLAEHLDNSIAYGEYLAESIETNIAYAEYIAENLDDNMSYVDYIGESLDNSLKYSKMIAEKLNGNKLFESADDEDRIPMPEESNLGFSTIEEEEEENEIDHEEDQEASIENTPELENTPDAIETEEDQDLNTEEEEEEQICDDDNENCEDDHSTQINIKVEESTDLSKQIDMLINEAKKRKASETNEHHFLKFLNKSQIDNFYSLTPAEQETVVSYINEKKAIGNSYMSSKDVLTMIKESLSLKSETLEERLLRLMPEQIKPIWQGLNESAKISILSQAKLHPDLGTEQLVEHFWLTRSLRKNESVNKKLLSTDTLIQEDKLSDDKVNSILEKFRQL